MAYTNPIESLRFLLQLAVEDPLYIEDFQQLLEEIQKEQDLLTALAIPTKALTVHGTDWNNGTHAKVYRPKIIEAVSAIIAHEKEKSQ